MLIYVAALPQFIDQQGDVTLQAITLSVAFIFWCGVVFDPEHSLVSHRRAAVSLNKGRGLQMGRGRIDAARSRFHGGSSRITFESLLRSPCRPGCRIRVKALWY
jgi:hypothetical protein